MERNQNQSPVFSKTWADASSEDSAGISIFGVTDKRVATFERAPYFSNMTSRMRSIMF